MKTRIIIFNSLLLILFAFSCNTEDEVDSQESIIEDLLTIEGGRWFAEGQTGLVLDECDKHTNYTFLENGNLQFEIYDDSSGTCEIGVSISGIWKLISETELVLLFEGQTSIVNIESVTVDVLVLSWKLEDETVTYILDKSQGNG